MYIRCYGKVTYGGYRHVHTTTKPCSLNAIYIEFISYFVYIVCMYISFAFIFRFFHIVHINSCIYIKSLVQIEAILIQNDTENGLQKEKNRKKKQLEKHLMIDLPYTVFGLPLSPFFRLVV